MMKTSRTLLVVMAAVILSSASSQASLTIDDFTGAIDQPNITRTITGPSTVISGEGVAYLSNGSLTYTTTGGNSFSDIISEAVNGFSIGANVTEGQSYDLNVYLDDSLTSSFYSEITGPQNIVYTGSDFGSAMKITFELSEFSGGFLETFALIGGGEGSGAFSAVPEPTSLILVGMAVVGMVVPRRRISA